MYEGLKISLIGTYFIQDREHEEIHVYHVMEIR